MSNAEDSGGGFRPLGSILRPMLMRLLDTQLQEGSFAGGWVAMINRDDQLVTLLHGPTGTRSTMLVSPNGAFYEHTFTFYSFPHLQGGQNQSMEAVHRFFWLEWDGVGDPWIAYCERKQTIGAG